MSAITSSQYFYGHLDPPQEVQDACEGLLDKVNSLLADPSCPDPDPGVRSGWRPADYNATVKNAAPNSNHITGHAVDLNDNDAALDNWLDEYEAKDPTTGKSRNEMLEKYGLYREHPLATKSWCHLQDVSPKSGNRTYYP